MLPAPERVEAWFADGALAAGLLIAAIIVSVVAELAFPIGRTQDDPPGRLRTNVVLGATNLLVDALLPVSTLALVATTRAQGWGLLPLLGIGGWIAVALSTLVVSAAQYWLHRLSHRHAWLWRIHRVHHADPALDITTALRQHPLNRPLAVVWHGAIGIVLGLAPLGMVLAALVTLLWSIFQHADVRLAPRLDRGLAWFVATPSIHRLHHSARRHETDSNYGEVLTVWDRLFGTWRATHTDDQHDMPLGLDDPDHARLGAQLLSPFRR